MLVICIFNFKGRLYFSFTFVNLQIGNNMKMPGNSSKKSVTTWRDCGKNTFA